MSHLALITGQAVCIVTFSGVPMQTACLRRVLPPCPAFLSSLAIGPSCRYKRNRPAPRRGRSVFLIIECLALSPG